MMENGTSASKEGDEGARGGVMGSENVVGPIALGPSREEVWLPSEWSADEPEERHDV